MKFLKKTSQDQLLVVHLPVSISSEKSSTSYPKCSEKRGNRQRTLYVPTEMVEDSNEDDVNRMINGLCCVYTKVEVSSSIDKPKLKLYDGSNDYYSNKSSFENLVEEVTDDICDMYMGSEDCKNNRVCLRGHSTPSKS